MINFIIKTVEIITHILYNKEQAKDCVLDVVSNIQENAQDIYAGAQQINDDRAAANEAEEAEGQDEAEETAEAEKNETEEKAE